MVKKHPLELSAGWYAAMALDLTDDLRPDVTFREAAERTGVRIEFGLVSSNMRGFVFRTEGITQENFQTILFETTQNMRSGIVISPTLTALGNRILRPFMDQRERPKVIAMMQHHVVEEYKYSGS